MCELTTSFTLDCKNGVGGVKQITLGNWTEPVNVTLNGAGEVTGLGGVTNLHTYDLPPQTADFKDTVSYNKEAGTYFYTQTCTIMIHLLSAAKRAEFINLVQSRLVLFVLDANDNFWVCDPSRPVDVTALEASTGKGLGDANGYTITFTCESPNPAYKCLGTSALDLI